MSTAFWSAPPRLVIQFILTLIIAFYFLVDIDRLRARLFYLAPEKWRGLMGQYRQRCRRRLFRLSARAADCLRPVRRLYHRPAVRLSFLHHPLAQYALLVGAAAGVLYAVPYLGALSTALVTFLVAFAAATADGASGLAFGGIAARRDPGFKPSL